VKRKYLIDEVILHRLLKCKHIVEDLEEAERNNRKEAAADNTTQPKRQIAISPDDGERRTTTGIITDGFLPAELQKVVQLTPSRYRHKIESICRLLSESKRFRYHPKRGQIEIDGSGPVKETNLIELLVDLVKKVSPALNDQFPIDWERPGLKPLLDLLGKDTELPVDWLGRDEFRRYVKGLRKRDDVDDDNVVKSAVSSTTIVGGGVGWRKANWK